MIDANCYNNRWNGFAKEFRNRYGFLNKQIFGKYIDENLAFQHT